MGREGHHFSLTTEASSALEFCSYPPRFGPFPCRRTRLSTAPPCFHVARRDRSKPSAVRGPVDAPRACGNARCASRAIRKAAHCTSAGRHSEALRSPRLTHVASHSDDPV